MEPMSTSPMGMVAHIIASVFRLLWSYHSLRQSLHYVYTPCCSSYISFNMQPIAGDDLSTCQCAENTLWCKEG